MPNIIKRTTAGILLITQLISSCDNPNRERNPNTISLHDSQGKRWNSYSEVWDYSGNNLPTQSEKKGERSDYSSSSRLPTFNPYLNTNGSSYAANQRKFTEWKEKIDREREANIRAREAEEEVRKQQREKEWKELWINRDKEKQQAKEEEAAKEKRDQEKSERERIEQEIRRKRGEDWEREMKEIYRLDAEAKRKQIERQEAARAERIEAERKEQAYKRDLLLQEQAREEALRSKQEAEQQEKIAKKRKKQQNKLAKKSEERDKKLEEEKEAREKEQEARQREWKENRKKWKEKMRRSEQEIEERLQKSAIDREERNKKWEEEIRRSEQEIEERLQKYAIDREERSKKWEEEKEARKKEQEVHQREWKQSRKQSKEERIWSQEEMEQELKRDFEEIERNREEQRKKYQKASKKKQKEWDARQKQLQQYFEESKTKLLQDQECDSSMEEDTDETSSNDEVPVENIPYMTTPPENENIIAQTKLDLEKCALRSISLEEYQELKTSKEKWLEFQTTYGMLLGTKSIYEGVSRWEKEKIYQALERGEIVPPYNPKTYSPLEKANGDKEMQGRMVQYAKRKVDGYLQRSKSNKEFNACKEDIALIKEQLKADPSNKELIVLLEEKEIQLQQHPLYKEGISIGTQFGSLRLGMEKKAAAPFLYALGAAEMGIYAEEKAKLAKEYEKFANQIKEESIKPLREYWGCPNTPRGDRKAAVMLAGAAESIYDTAKGLVELGVMAINLAVYMYKLYVTISVKILSGQAAEDLKDFAEAVKEKSVDLVEILKIYYSKAQQAWEDREEYKKRIAELKEQQEKEDWYRRVFDAEAYHLEDYTRMGYWGTEVLQFVGGEKLLAGLARVASKSGKWIKGAEGVMEAAKAVQDLSKGEKIVESGKLWKAVGSIEEGSKLLNKRGIISNLLSPEGKKIGKKVGKDAAIRTVTKEEGERIIKELMELGAKKVENLRYTKGTWYELAGLGEFGIRTKPSLKSARYGTTHTIDLQQLNIEIKKLKF